MENKRLVSAMLALLVLTLGWIWFVQYLDRKNPQWNLLGSTPATQPATRPVASATTAPATAPALAVTPANVPTIQAPAAAVVPPAADPSASQAGSRSAGSTLSAVPSPGAVPANSTDGTVLLGSVDSNSPDHRVGLRLSPRGGGVESVTLNRYKLSVDKPDPYVFQTPMKSAALGDLSRVLATRVVTVNGTNLNFASLPFALTAVSADSATFSADILDAGTPVLRVAKTYTLTKPDSETGGYEVRLAYTLTNLGGSNATAAVQMNGTAAPPWEIERGPERQVVHAYLNEKSVQVILRHAMAESFSSEKTVVDLTRDGSDPHPLSWFGGSGAYFNALVRPDPWDPKMPAANYLAKVEAVLLNPDEKDSHEKHLLTTLQTQPMQLAPGQAATLPFRLYLGPKQRALLDTPYYTNYPLDFDQTLVTTSWICSFCTFQWMIGILVAMLNAFHFVVRDWGVAIIFLVFVVRLLLHPLTRAQQQNIFKMGKMAPEMERIKKKYGDDKEAQQREMMQLYKAQGAAPILGCLPIFLQMPIWLALYAGLQSTFELRHQPFLYGLTWINDLAKPDHLIQFEQSFMLCGMVNISGLNLIPFLLGVVFFLQFKFTPKPPVQTPEQIQQQKMMQWMTVLFPVFLYAAPAGLNIYIFASTTFGIIENKLIRDAIKRREDAAGAGRVIDAEVVSKDDAKPERKPLSAAAKKQAGEKSKGLMGWLADMQEKAEEIRRQQEQKGKQGKKK